MSKMMFSNELGSYNEAATHNGIEAVQQGLSTFLWRSRTSTHLHAEIFATSWPVYYHLYVYFMRHKLWCTRAPTRKTTPSAALRQARGEKMAPASFYGVKIKTRMTYSRATTSPLQQERQLVIIHGYITRQGRCEGGFLAKVFHNKDWWNTYEPCIKSLHESIILLLP